MVYYEVQFLSPVHGNWITVKEFDDSTGALLPLSDSAEQLSSDEAEMRLLTLTKKYPFLTFRINKLIL
ncbi:hypothetical protein GCM10028825_49040 [Spirosoma agri]